MRSSGFGRGEVYAHPATGFELAPPEGWFLVEETADGAAFSPAFAPSDRSPRLGVLVQDVSASPMTLAEFTDVSRMHLERALGVRLRVAERNLAGRSGRRAEYAVPSGDGSGATTTFLQAWTLVPGSAAYVVTYNAASDGGDYDCYAPAALRCVDSFSLSRARRRFRDHCSTLFLARRAACGMALLVPASWLPCEDGEGCWETRGPLSSDPEARPVLVRVALTADALPQRVADAPQRYAAMARRHVERVARRGSVVALSAADAGGGWDGGFRFDAADNGALREGTRFAQRWAVRGGRAVVLSFTTDCALDEERPLALFDRIAARCSPSGELSCTWPGASLYENLPKRFALAYPESFIPQEGFMGSTVTFFATPPGTSEAGFETTLGVIVREQPPDASSAEPATLDSLCEVLKQQIVGQEGCTLLSERDSDSPLAGAPARVMSYDASSDGVSVRFSQCAAVMEGGKQAVIVSFGCIGTEFDSQWRRFDIERCILSAHFF